MPSPTVELLDLFHGPLRDVRFPDADGDRLRAVVEDAIVASDAVTRAEAAVEAARAVLRENLATVAHETERALAYARVYAAERPELRATLDALGSASPRRTPGRRRKALEASGAKSANEVRTKVASGAACASEPEDTAEAFDSEASAAE